MSKGDCKCTTGDHNFVSVGKGEDVKRSESEDQCEDKARDETLGSIKKHCKKSRFFSNNAADIGASSVFAAFFCDVNAM